MLVSSQFHVFGTLSTPIASKQSSFTYEHGKNIINSSLSPHETCYMVNDLHRDVLFQEKHIDIDSKGIFIP